MGDHDDNEHGGRDALNDAIRADAGRAPAESSDSGADASTSEPEAAERPSDIAIARAIAASEAGLPLDAGRWVRGETIEEIRQDAKRFAADVAAWQGRLGGGLDGGARGTRHSESPSVESVLRAEADLKRQERDSYVDYYEQGRRERRNGGE